MKKSYQLLSLLLALLAFSTKSFSQNNLAAGDLAIVSYQSDFDPTNPLAGDDDIAQFEDRFSLVVLKPGGLTAGTVIFFTTRGWNGPANTWHDEDFAPFTFGLGRRAVVSWTVPAGGIASGTEVFFINKYHDEVAVGSEYYDWGAYSDYNGTTALGVMANVTPIVPAANSTDGMSFAVSGDKLLVYQTGPVAGPNAGPNNSTIRFITALLANNNGTTVAVGTTTYATWDAIPGAMASNESSVPPGLVNGQTCFLMSPSILPAVSNGTTEPDNGKFSACALSGAGACTALQMSTIIYATNPAGPVPTTPNWTYSNNVFPVGTSSSLCTYNILPTNSITLTSVAGTNVQTRCINTAITNITYSTIGATGATFSGLPAGVTGNWAANVVTISGAPTTTVGSPFNYTVTLTGGCGTVTATGTITVTPNNVVTLTSVAGTNAQTVCINTPITNITYSTTGATGATISGLPAGVTGNWAANVVTISGTPTTTVGSPFSYTVTLTGGCGVITATGTITVNGVNSITLTSGVGTNVQSVLVNTPITNITYSTTNATGATFSGLPPGVTGNWAANVVTISGSPTTAVASPYNYTVTLTGGCGVVTATGTITVTTCSAVDQTVTASPTTICAGASSTITVAASQPGVNYTLRIDPANTVVAGPTASNGPAINFNTGAIAATTTYNVLAETDKYSVYLNGGEAGFVIPQNSALDVTNNFTIEGWIKPDGIGSAFSRMFNKSQSYALGLSGGQSQITFTRHNSGDYSVPFAFVTGQWYHIASTYASGTVEFFVNGASVGTVAVPAIVTANQGAQIGSESSSFHYFKGNIDNVRIWNSVRTPAEIAANQTAFLTSTGNPALVASWWIIEGAGNARDYSANAINATSLAGTWQVDAPVASCSIVLTTKPTVSITPNNTITLTSAAGTNAQTVCINTPITNITYSTTGATGATFSGLPAGVTGGWAANIVTISGTPTTTVGSPFNYTVTLTGGCSAVVTATGTITVNPIPTVNAVSNVAVCSNTATAVINFSGTPAGVVFNWTNNTTSIGLAASGTGNIPSFTATNATNAPVTATITVTPSYTSGPTCTGTPITFTITVNPSNTVAQVAAQTVCNGANTTAITFSSTATGGSVVYNWTGTVATIGLPASGSGNIASFTAINTGTTVVTDTIKVTAAYTNGGTTCNSAVMLFVITVNPTPTVNAVADQTVCNGAPTAAVTFSGAVAGTVYQWTNNTTSIGLGASGTGNIASFIATNATAAPVTAAVTVTPVFYNQSISGSLLPGDLTMPNRLFRDGVPAGCGGKAFPGTSAGAHLYDTYSFVNTTGQAQCVTITYVAKSTGDVFVAAYNGSFNPASLATNYIGDGGLSSIGGSVNTFSVNVAAGATLVLVALEANSAPCPNYVISVSGIGMSCTGTPRTFNITVNPTPTVNAVASQVVCNGTATTAVTFSGAVAGTVYNWTNNTASIGLAASGSGNIASFTAINVTAAPVVATITVTPAYTNGGTTCNGTPISFTITVNPSPDVAQPANQVVCNGAPTAPVNFTGAVPGTIFNWTNNTTSIGLAASGTGNIASFTATNVTNAPVVATVTVTPTLTSSSTATFNYTGSAQTWTVPAGVTSISVDASGAAGGRAWSVGLIGNAGRGGRVQATLAVTPGEVLQVNVGGKGINGFTQVVAPGGFNGGANGGFFYLNATDDQAGGSGGGGSDIRQGGTNLINRIIVASGGGGAASCSSSPYDGGNGGGLIGSNGTSCGTQGGGGTQSAGGAGGDYPGYCSATAGSLGSGGAGCSPSGGAGGGGGYYGGGGGAWGAGAGGSSYAIPAATGTIHTPNFNPADGQIIITYSVASSCLGTPKTFTITVNPTPTVNAVSNQVVCNGATTTAVNFSGSVPGTVYNWTNNTASIGLAASGTGNIASFTATNIGTAPVVATITVTPSYTNAGTTCTGTPITFTITVNPTPTVNAVANQVVCNGAATTAVNFSGAVAGTVYNWANNTPSIGLAASGTGNIASFTATNASTAPVVATITVTPTYTNGGTTCTGTPTSFTITVNPTATINAVANQVVCNGGATTSVTFSSPTTGGTIVYNWTNNTTSIGLAASGTGNIPSFTATNATNAPVVATITVTPTYTNGTVCVGTPITFTYTVNPTATINPVANQVLCNGANSSPVNFTSPATGGTIVYNWTNNLPSIGLAASGTGNIASFVAVNLTAAPVVATITVTPTYTNGAVSCVGTPISFTITVNPPPVINPVANQVVCNNTATAAVVFTTPTTGGTAVFNWTNNNTTIGLLAASGTGNIPSFIGTNTGTSPNVATITVIMSYTSGGITCVSLPLTFTYTVNPTATINVVADQVVCNGSATAAINFTSPTTGGTIVYNWTNTTTSIGLAAAGTGNIASFTATNITNTPVVATITVTPTYTNGGVSCAGTPISFTITVNPTPVVNAVSSQTVCANTTTAPVVFTSPTTGGTVTYNWTNSNITIGLGASGTGNIPSFIGLNGTNAPNVANLTVTPVFTNGGVSCTGSPVSFTITVNPVPIVNPVANQVVCNGALTAPINFTSPTTGPTGALQFTWVNDNATIGLALSGTGSIPGFTAINSGITPVVATIIVTPVYTNGGVTCTGPSITFTITVNPSPTVTQPANQVLCNGTPTAPVVFTGTVAGTVFNWTNTNTTIGLAASGAGNIASFTATNATNIVQTATITVTPVYTNGGVSCSGTPRTFTITVNPTPSVTPVANQTVCAGTTVTANFTGPVAGTVYNWTNNNTAIGLAASGTGNISFVSTNISNAPITGTVTVTPIFTNGGVSCSGTPITFTVTVNPIPVVNAVANQTVCNGSATTAVTFSGPVAGTVYNWTNNTVSIGLAASGTGNIASFTATNLTNAPVTATITVTPVFTNGGATCTGASRTFTITVNPTPSVTPIANQVVCNGALTADITITGPVAGTVYNWTNNNTSIGLAAGGAGSIAAFTAINSSNVPVTATITVTPTYSNGGANCTGPSITFTITVNPTPTVNAVASQVLCNGSPTAAVSFSGGVAGTVYNWTNSNTTIGLAAAGTGNIASFTATNATGIIQTATITVTPSASGCSGASTSFTITVNPTPTVNQPANQIVCDGATTAPVIFTGAAAGTVYSWTNNAPQIGLGVSGTGNIPAFVAKNATAFPVVATITVTPRFTNGGVTCTGTAVSFTITVNPQSNIVFNMPPRACLTDTLIILKASPAGGTWSGRGVSGNTFSAAAAGVGVHVLSYTFTNQSGCTTVSYFNITVNDCIERHNVFATAIRIYPNPSSGLFNIRFLSDIYTAFNVNVVTADGKVLKAYQFNNLRYGSVIPMDLRILPGGTYFLQIYNATERAHFPFVIVR